MSKKDKKKNKPLGVGVGVLVPSSESTKEVLRVLGWRKALHLMCEAFNRSLNDMDSHLLICVMCHHDPVSGETVKTVISPSDEWNSIRDECLVEHIRELCKATYEDKVQ